MSSLFDALKAGLKDKGMDRCVMAVEDDGSLLTIGFDITNFARGVRPVLVISIK